MGSTSGTRATTGAAGVAALTGITLTGHGILRASIPQAVGGSCLTMAALIIIALVLIRRWVSDTRDVRNALAATQREVERERSRYFALQMALEGEQGRLTRDMATERRRIAAILIREREKMDADFEEKRAALISETVEATVLMIHNGKLAPNTPATGQLIHFPTQQQPAPATERARSREHGVVGP
jgi:hypothetical protein